MNAVLQKSNLFTLEWVQLEIKVCLKKYSRRNIYI